MIQSGVFDLPLRHLSIRVPWHDTGWTGVVCHSPQLNGACVKLKGIAAAEKDKEQTVAGRSLDELPREQWPCCLDEPSGFMAPFELELIKRHALASKNPEYYGHFRPAAQRYPAYSAGIVPFRWMMVENMESYRDLYELDVDSEREPEPNYKSNWVHEAENRTLRHQRGAVNDIHQYVMAVSKGAKKPAS